MSFFRNSVSLFNIAHKRRNQMGLNLTGLSQSFVSRRNMSFSHMSNTLQNDVNDVNDEENILKNVSSSDTTGNITNTINIDDKGIQIFTCYIALINKVILPLMD